MDNKTERVLTSLWQGMKRYGSILDSRSKDWHGKVLEVCFGIVVAVFVCGMIFSYSNSSDVKSLFADGIDWTSPRNVGEAYFRAYVDGNMDGVLTCVNRPSEIDREAYAKAAKSFGLNGCEITFLSELEFDSNAVMGVGDYLVRYELKNGDVKYLAAVVIRRMEDGTYKADSFFHELVKPPDTFHVL